MLRVLSIGCILIFSATASEAQLKKESLMFQDLLNGEIGQFDRDDSVITQEGDTLTRDDRAAIDEEAKRLSQEVGSHLAAAKALLDSLREVESKSLKIRNLESLVGPGRRINVSSVMQQMGEDKLRLERLADSAAHLEEAIRKLETGDLGLLHARRALPGLPERK